VDFADYKAQLKIPAHQKKADKAWFLIVVEQVLEMPNGSIV